jgi:hypothetical protein
MITLCRFGLGFFGQNLRLRPDHRLTNRIEALQYLLRFTPSDSGAY